MSPLWIWISLGCLVCVCLSSICPFSWGHDRKSVQGMYVCSFYDIFYPMKLKNNQINKQTKKKAERTSTFVFSWLSYQHPFIYFYFNFIFLYIYFFLNLDSYHYMYTKMCCCTLWSVADLDSTSWILNAYFNKIEYSFMLHFLPSPKKWMLGNELENCVDCLIPILLVDEQTRVLHRTSVLGKRSTHIQWKILWIPYIK